ncbi:MAG: NAD-dependent epimerase/dehydratase family protein, partial [Candidatus Kariarchaeaceae archaeon]
MISFQANTWFVTGATGLVGSSIVRELKRNELNVIALVRDQSPQDMIDLLTRLEVKIVVGDLLDRSTYAEYIATCDVVVHAAAAVQIRDEETNWKVNLEGTRSICEAMQEMGKTRIIYISTAGLYGGSSLDPVKEETPINPFGPYLESKAAAEDLILNSNRG